MGKWIPNIVAYKYLSSIGPIDNEKKNELTENIQLGYNKLVLNLQTDKHNEHGYQSYWNNYKSLQKGSGQFKVIDHHTGFDQGDWIWNSAYFAKLLLIVNFAVKTDDKYVSKLLNFAKSKQNLTDGSFHDHVHISYYCSHSSGTKIPITAFIASALMEKHDNYKTNIDAAINYLIVNVPNMKTDFEKAIAADAISLAIVNFKTKKYSITLEKLFESLILTAVTANEKMHWNVNDLSLKATAIQIETASYVLMAMLRMKNNNVYMKYVINIMNWLVSVKNSDGGYTSTHDTGKD